MKNKIELKKCLIVSILTILIFEVCFGVIFSIQYKKYTQNTNIVINGIVEEVVKEYPKADKNEIVKILNGEKTNQNNLLKEYGIDIEKDSVIYENEKTYQKFMRINLAFLMVSLLTIVIIFIIYNQRKDKKIKEITKYIEEINRKNYSLKIQNNTEDELSILQNELYKITIMLKEQAENSINEKMNLKDSLADISHQLKTPLTSILIMLDNLSQSNNMDEITREKFINEIARQIESMNWLVISLLKLSKLDAGVIEFQNEKINIKEMIKEIISNLEIISEIKNVKIKISSNKETYFIGDYNWNKEAIQNIVKNAIEHTKENTEIDVNIEENDVYTSISITDNGEGISNEDLKHIFDRFYKSKNSAENSFGIGLSLSKSIIEKQNGYIQVETEQGKGTTFIIKYVKV